MNRYPSSACPPLMLACPVLVPGVSVNGDVAPVRLGRLGP